MLLIKNKTTYFTIWTCFYMSLQITSKCY